MVDLTTHVSHSELVSVRDAALKVILDTIRKDRKFTDNATELLFLTMNHIVCEMLFVYSEAKRGNDAMKHNRVLRIGAPHGLTAIPFYYPILKRCKDILKKEEVAYKKPSAVKQSETLTFSYSPQMAEHRRQRKEKLVIGKFVDWFPAGELPVSYEEIELPALMKDVLKKVKAVFKRKGKFSLTEAQEAYLIKAIHYFFESTKVLLSALEKKKRYLPKRFWVGTSGIIYNKVFGYMVRKNGGYVCGHDHGTGSGWISSFDQVLLECNYVDEFVVYSKGMQAGLRANLRDFKDYLLQKAPKVTALAAPSVKKAKPISSNNPKRIMLVTTAYSDVSAEFIPKIQTGVLYPFHAHLVNLMCKMGKEVVLRPHPECRLKELTMQLAEKYNVAVSQGPFKEDIKDVDMLVFDFPLSTALVEGIKAQKPIVVFDLHIEEISKKARPVLEERAALIAATEKQLLAIEKKSLEASFEKANSMVNNSSFEETFYPWNI